MFATILGRLPRAVPPTGATDNELVETAIRAQEAAGLEPLTDGALRWPALDEAIAGRGPSPLDAWRAAAGVATRAVKAQLPGPYSLARRRAHTSATTVARELRIHLVALSGAGCPLVEIVEDEAHRIGTDPVQRAAYRDAHSTLTDGVTDTHLSLAIVDGNADTAGIETILAPAYASLAVDLIAGPDNWRLVTAATPGIGVILGAMSSAADGDEGPEMVLWAARYAASGSRGSARIGVALVPGLERLSWDVAVRKLNALGEAARIAALPPGDELADAVDPRSIDIRTAAMGRRPRR